MLMSSRRPAALSRGPTAKPRSAATSSGNATLRNLQQRLNAGNALACTNPSQPLFHQHAIVRVQRHKVGHRPQRDQVQPLRHRATGIGPESTGLQLALQGCQHVERHADAGQRTAAELAAGKIGIDDDIRSGQRRAREGGGR